MGFQVRVSKYTSSPIFNEPFLGKCVYGKVFKKHFCWSLSNISWVFKLKFVFLESGPLLYVHMFPLLLDCLEFFFSYLSYFKDDQLSLLCRAIVLVSIALGGDKNGRISFGANQKKAIFLGSRVDQCISHANF